jgi:hypothetical protein
MFEKLKEWRAKRIMQRSRYSKQLEELPPNLYLYWKSSAKNETDGIPGDAVFFARSAEGLMAFFDCVTTAGKPCALPSRAADSVWHAWQRLAPMKLEAFCRKHYGCDIPHLEQAAMPGRMDDALAASLVRSRELERLPPEGPRLPSLFLLDRRLKMPHGFGYVLQRGRPGFGGLDRRGRLMHPVSSPPALEAAGLLAAGLITQLAYEDYLQRIAHRSDGSSCGSGCGSSVSCDGSSGGDGGCGDGGSSGGGSSCGSSCGGSS